MSKMPPADELRRLYVDEGLSSRKIGKRFSVAQQTAHRWLVRAGVPTRRSSEGAGRPVVLVMPPVSELRRLYVDEGMSAYAIDRHFSMKRGTTRRWLMRAGIPSRRQGNAGKPRVTIYLGAIKAHKENA